MLETKLCADDSVCWFGLTVGVCMAQNQKSRVNSYMVCHGDSTIDIDIHITKYYY